MNSNLLALIVFYCLKRLFKRFLAISNDPLLETYLRCFYALFNCLFITLLIPLMLHQSIAIILRLSYLAGILFKHLLGKSVKTVSLICLLIRKFNGLPDYHLIFWWFWDRSDGKESFHFDNCLLVVSEQLIYFLLFFVFL